jgi:hypothetical protein
MNVILLFSKVMALYRYPICQPQDCWKLEKSEELLQTMK